MVRCRSLRKLPCAALLPSQRSIPSAATQNACVAKRIWPRCRGRLPLTQPVQSATGSSLRGYMERFNTSPDLAYQGYAPETGGGRVRRFCPGAPRDDACPADEGGAVCERI